MFFMLIFSDFRMSEFLIFDTSSKNHAEHECSFFINCSTCVRNRIPAEVRFLSATAMSAKNQVAPENCSILKQDAALSSVFVHEWHKYRRANSLQYSSEDIFHVE